VASQDISTHADDEELSSCGPTVSVNVSKFAELETRMHAGRRHVKDEEDAGDDALIGPVGCARHNQDRPLRHTASRDKWGTNTPTGRIWKPSASASWRPTLRCTVQDSSIEAPMRVAAAPILAKHGAVDGCHGRFVSEGALHQQDHEASRVNGTTGRVWKPSLKASLKVRH